MRTDEWDMVWTDLNRLGLLPAYLKQEKTMTAFERETMKGARLMLYAWKAARHNMKLPDNHDELNEIIKDLETCLEEQRQCTK